MALNSILLVEDNMLAQRAAKIILSGFALQIDIASSGQEAIDLSKLNIYDLILMDIGLGDMTGFEVEQNIRQDSLLNQETRIFALTAHDDKEYEEKAINSGMQGYLIKPISTAVLAAILEK